MEKFIPRSHKAKTPPMAAIGTAEKIRSACFTEWNEKYNSTKMSNSATGTAMESRAFAAARFWNCPPYEI